MIIEFYFETRTEELLVQSSVGGCQGFQDPMLPLSAHQEPIKAPVNSDTPRCPILIRRK